MKIFQAPKNDGTVLEQLEAALAGLHNFGQEEAKLLAQETQAKNEIQAVTAGSAGNPVNSPDALARVARATETLNAVRARPEQIEVALAAALSEPESLYRNAKAYWQGQVETRRQLCRAALLAANLPLFDHDERRTADALQGILTPQMGRLYRAGWNGFGGGPRTAARRVEEIKCFIGFVKERAADLGIPVTN